MLETKPRFSPERSFQHEVQSRVEERLATLGRSRYGGRRIYLKTALLLLWSGASYVALLAWAQSWWQVVPLSVSLGLALAAIGFNIAHDDLGALCRMSRYQPRLPHHRLQHLYMWILYGFIVPKW